MMYVFSQVCDQRERQLPSVAPHVQRHWRGCDTNGTYVFFVPVAALGLSLVVFYTSRDDLIGAANHDLKGTDKSLHKTFSSVPYFAPIWRRNQRRTGKLHMYTCGCAVCKTRLSGVPETSGPHPIPVPATTAAVTRVNCGIESTVPQMIP